MTLDISYGSLDSSITSLMNAISWQLVAESAAEMFMLFRLLSLEHLG